MLRQVYTFLALLVMVGCHDDLETSNRIFRYNLPNNVTSLDPAFAKNRNNIWVVDHLYSTLVQFDDQMNIIPDLASSWEVSEDGLNYTFYLRDSVMFRGNSGLEIHRPLNSQDVQYSLERLLDPQVKSPGSWILSGRLDETRPFSTPDDLTFVIHLNQPFPAMLGILTMQYCSVVCQEAVEHFGDEFRQNAVGTGPFDLVKWVENQGLFLKSNASYHLPVQHNLEGVRVSFISDRKSALLELLSGNLDFQSGMDPSYQAILLNDENQLLEQHRDKIRIVKSPYLNTEYLGINLELANAENHPLSDRNLRKALNYALDKTKMIQSLRSGFGRPAHQGFIPFGMNAFSSQTSGYTYDLAKARHYLAQSDYIDRTGVNRKITLYTNSDYLDLCLFASNEWNKIGVEVEVELLESSLLRERMRKGEIVFFRASWIGDYPDDETFLTVFYGQNPAPPNYTRFNHTPFNQLYESALLQADPDKRRQTYAAMDSLLIEEAPVIFMFYDETLLLTSSRLKGISKNAFNLLRTDSIGLIQQ